MASDYPESPRSSLKVPDDSTAIEVDHNRGRNVLVHVSVATVLLILVVASAAIGGIGWFTWRCWTERFNREVPYERAVEETESPDSSELSPSSPAAAVNEAFSADNFADFERNIARP